MEQLSDSTIIGCVSLISSPPSNKILVACAHGWEMTMSLIVITIFAYNEFECGICADSHNRQANNNPYIKTFIFVGWITMAIDLIFYGILLCARVFKDIDDIPEHPLMEIQIAFVNPIDVVKK